MGKSFGLFIISCCIATKLLAQNDTVWVYTNDTRSPEAIVDALYTVISGPAGEKRNWERFRKLFTPEAKIIPIGARSGGESVKRALSIEEYITTSGPFLEKEGLKSHYITVERGKGVVLKGKSISQKIADKLVLKKAKWIKTVLRLH